MVYLHWPRVFHNLMVLSRDPDTICRLSAEKATLNTSFLWSLNLRVVLPLFLLLFCLGIVICQKEESIYETHVCRWVTHWVKSQSRRVPSHEPDKQNWPSDEMTASDTKWLWPLSALYGVPHDDSSLFNFQTMSVLSVCCCCCFRQIDCVVNKNKRRGQKWDDE